MSRVIARAIQFIVIAAVAFSFFGLIWATREGDRYMIDRQSQLARHALESSVDDVALQQETVAVWDELALEVAKPKPDREWLEGNAGGYLNQLFGHDEVYILNKDDRPVFAHVGKRDVDPVAYGDVEKYIRHIHATMREQRPGDHGIHDFLPGSTQSNNMLVRPWRTYHDAHLVMVRGRPAAVSAMNIIPATEGFVTKQGHWPMLISIRYLDGAFLPQLSSREMVRDPRFALTPTVSKEERAIPLYTEWDEPMGYFIFKPELFGTQILGRLIPLVALIMACVAIFAFLTGSRLRRTAHALEQAQSDAAHLADHDKHTGLANRGNFQRSLTDRIARYASTGKPFGLAMFDVDEFKLINDTMGHDAGDAVLSSFAQRIQSIAGPNDLTARLGGDEFAIVLGDVSDRGELTAVAGRILDLLSQPFDYRGQTVQCRASIGAALLTPGSTAADLLKCADLALYEAKASGRATFRLFDPSMWQKMSERQEMFRLAERALENDHVRAYYQPKVRLGTGEVVGFEALMRICVPGEPTVGPETIYAAFQDTTLAARLADRMADNVLRDIMLWQSRGLDFGHIAINASESELKRSDFADRLLNRIDRDGIEASAIQIEVTESVLFGRGAEHVERTFRKLADRGIKLALDDFGTGFASLSHLKQFPVAIIKIDRSFVRDLQIDPGDGAIVDALIGLAGAIQVDVVAEGIETPAQRDFLHALGCTYGQGFLFGPARTFDQTCKLLSIDTERQSKSAA